MHTPVALEFHRARVDFAFGAPQALRQSRLVHRIGCFSSDGLSSLIKSYGQSRANLRAGTRMFLDAKALPRTIALGGLTGTSEDGVGRACNGLPLAFWRSLSDLLPPANSGSLPRAESANWSQRRILTRNASSFVSCRNIDR